MSCGLFCLPGTIACQTLDFFIRFRSDVWPGQRDGRRLFRHAVPGCFPDLKGVLWLVLCAWNNCLPDPLARAEGRRLFRHAMPGCFPDLKGVLATYPPTYLPTTLLHLLPATYFYDDYDYNYDYHYSLSRLFREVDLMNGTSDLLDLVLCAWNNCLPDP